MYLHRTIETFVTKAADHLPVLLVTGARQVGKTTLLQHLSEKDRSYVTLDDPLILNLAREDPALFFQRFPPPAFIDEIQYAPGLLHYIKMEADRTRRSGTYRLTGSRPFHMMKGISESLAGRVGVVQPLGLSRRERVGKGLESRPFLPTPDEIERRTERAGRLSLKEVYRLI